MSADDDDLFVMLSVRLPQTMIDRLDETAERLKDEPEFAWGRMTRSLTLRLVLQAGLMSFDKKYPKKRRRKR